MSDTIRVTPANATESHNVGVVQTSPWPVPTYVVDSTKLDSLPSDMRDVAKRAGDVDSVQNGQEIRAMQPTSVSHSVPEPIKGDETPGGSQPPSDSRAVALARSRHAELMARAQAIREEEGHLYDLLARVLPPGSVSSQEEWDEFVSRALDRS